MKTLLHIFSTLRQAGLQMRAVYDVGACVGAWSRAVRDEALPQAEFILFEANETYAPLLAASGFRHFSGVLSAPGRTHVDFYSRHGTGDSYYRENTTYYDGLAPVRLPCTTLDALAATHRLPPPDVIKLDTQGSELDILAGAATLLGGVSLIATECPIVRYNSGAPSLQDYLDFFRQRAFVPIALTDTHHLENTLVQVDMLFMAARAKERFLGPNVNIRPFADL